MRFPALHQVSVLDPWKGMLLSGAICECLSPHYLRVALMLWQMQFGKSYTGRWVTFLVVKPIC